MFGSNSMPTPAPSVLKRCYADCGLFVPRKCSLPSFSNLCRMSSATLRKVSCSSAKGPYHCLLLVNANELSCLAQLGCLAINLEQFLSGVICSARLQLTCCPFCIATTVTMLQATELFQALCQGTGGLNYEAFEAAILALQELVMSPHGKSQDKVSALCPLGSVVFRQFCVQTILGSLLFV